MALESWAAVILVETAVEYIFVAYTSAFPFIDAVIYHFGRTHSLANLRWNMENRWLKMRN